MEVTQSVYIRMESYRLTSEEMSAGTGLPHDEDFSSRSKHQSPSTGVFLNLWRFGSGLDSSAGLTDHFEALKERVGASASSIKAFSVLHGEKVFVTVHREYSPSPTDAEMGFSLSHAFIDFLTTAGAELDFDEYDYSQPEE